MVRIVQAYNFSKQGTYSVSGEILASTLIGTTRIAVSSAGHFVEIHNICEKSSRDPPAPKCTLPTVGEVVDLVYNDAGKYLLTLERDNINCPPFGDGDKMFVRVYANFWKFPDEKLNDYPISIRIASMTTPKQPLLESLDVIELPLRNGPELIGCCQSSGNVVVTSKDRLYFYEYVTCQHEAHRFTYVDLLPFQFFVSLNFMPLRVQLCENIVACLNKTYVVAFKIVDISTLDAGDDADSNSNISQLSKLSGGQSSNNSFETDSLETCSRMGFNGAILDNSTSCREFDKELKSQVDQHEVDIRDVNIVPSKAGDIKIKIVYEWKALNDTNVSPSNKESVINYAIKKILQLCMVSIEPTHRILDIIKCMDVKPIYRMVPEYDNIKNPDNFMIKEAHPFNVRTLKSNIYQYCIAYSLLVATSVDGYLYQFNVQGSETETPIAKYSFTAPVIKVYINDLVIYAITTETVETHTSRVGYSIFSNRFGYPPVTNIFPEECISDVQTPVSVIGLCSFMNIKFANVNGQNLILISGSAVDTGGKMKKRCIRGLKSVGNIVSRTNESEPVTEWTLYKLTIPNIKSTVDDLENVAAGYKTGDSKTYFELMEEAHIMLRQTTCFELNLPVEERRLLEDQFIKNCRHLADYTIRSEAKDIHTKAIGLYKMCGWQLSDIYINFTSSTFDEHPSYAGLIYVAKHSLLTLGADRNAAAFLCQSVKPYFTKSSGKDSNLALELLQMFLRYCPQDIPSTMLPSPAVCDILSTSLLRYLGDKQERTPEEMLLFAVCAARVSNFDLSRQLIEQLNRKDLAVPLITHKNVLFDDHFSREVGTRSSFSDFTENVLMLVERSDLTEAISDAIIHSLCIEKSIPLETLLSLFLNYIATHIGLEGYHTSQKVFVNVLQVYYYDAYDFSYNANQFKSRISEEYSSLAPSLYDDSMQSEGSQIVFEERCNSMSGIWDSYARIHKFLRNDGNVLDANGSDSANGSLTDVNTSDINIKGLKILFRIYLGQLKSISESSKTESVVKKLEPSPDILAIRHECIKFIAKHVESLKQIHCQQSTLRDDRRFSGGFGKEVPFIPNYNVFEESSSKHYLRPIVCLNDRPSYLNHLEPFSKDCFSKRNDDDRDEQFTGWNVEALMVVLKIQSLLASPKVDPDIIEEFVGFVQKTPNLIGIDSFLAITLPKALAVNYLMHLQPDVLWHYGRSHGFGPKQWEALLKKIVSKENVLPGWKTHITDILNNLMEELPFEELLQCFPPEAKVNRNDQLKCSEMKEDNISMDSLDELSVFELSLRKAASRNRSFTLRSTTSFIRGQD